MRSAAARLPVSIVAAVIPSLDRAEPDTDTDGQKVHAPVIVPMWVAMGIACAAIMLPLYGHDISALPALVFLVVCPLAVAAVLLAGGDDTDAGS